MRAKVVKNKATGTPHEVYCIQPLLASDDFCRSLLRVLSIYVHRRGAFGVARFDNLGDARAFTLWNE